MMNRLYRRFLDWACYMAAKGLMSCAALHAPTSPITAPGGLEVQEVVCFGHILLRASASCMVQPCSRQPLQSLRLEGGCRRSCSMPEGATAESCPRSPAS